MTQVEKIFFSEEKKQKTFATLGTRWPGHVRQVAKVFWFFFSKKNILASALLLGAAAPVQWASLPLSRMDLPWWHARFVAKAEEMRREPVDLVWYGDSITQYWEAAGPEPWRNFAPVWRHYYGARHALNLGFKGDTTAHLLWRIENGEAAGIHPKAAVVLIGANNFGRVHWGAGPTEAGIVRIVDELHARLPGVRIVLISVLPCVRGPWVAEQTEAVNKALAAHYADGKQATFVDVTRLFLTDGRVDPAKFLDPHLRPPDPPLHPSAQTQAEIAAAIEPVLAGMLGDAARGP
jgi:lysophospholipase L1-like esterase